MNKTMTIEEYKKEELNKDLKPVHITFVIDRSGSMTSIASDVEGGVNNFIEDQKKVPGECKVTIWEFDSLDIYKAINGQNVKKAKYSNFTPRGATPLYDAIGKAILDTDKRDKEERQIVVIMTDGYENSSEEFSKEQIVDLIQAREEKGWIFTYLAANQDAFAVGGSMGFNNAMNFSATSRGTSAVYLANSSAISTARGTWAKGGSVNSSTLYDPEAQNATIKEEEKRV